MLCGTYRDRGHDRTPDEGATTWRSVSCATSSRSPRPATSGRPRSACTWRSRRCPRPSASWRRSSAPRCSTAPRAGSTSPRPASRSCATRARILDCRRRRAGPGPPHRRRPAAGCCGSAPPALAAFGQLPQLARIAARELPGLALQFVPDLLTPAQELALAEDRIDLGRAAAAAARAPGWPCARSTASGSCSRSRRTTGWPATSRSSARRAARRGLRRLRLAATRSSTPWSTQACLGAGFLPRRAHAGRRDADHAHAGRRGPRRRAAAGVGAGAARGRRRATRPVADDVHVELALAWRADDTTPALARLVEALEANGFVPPAADLPPSPTPTPTGGSR